MVDEAKRGAQEALYAAIQNQAETNRKAALSATEKAALLRDLAEAYRLTAGGRMPDGASRRAASSSGGTPPTRTSEASARPKRRAS